MHTRTYSLYRSTLMTTTFFNCTRRRRRRSFKNTKKQYNIINIQCEHRTASQRIAHGARPPHRWPGTKTTDGRGTGPVYCCVW